MFYLFTRFILIVARTVPLYCEGAQGAGLLIGGLRGDLCVSTITCTREESRILGTATGQKLRSERLDSMAQERCCGQVSGRGAQAVR